MRGRQRRVSPPAHRTRCLAQGLAEHDVRLALLLQQRRTQEARQHQTEGDAKRQDRQHVGGRRTGTSQREPAQLAGEDIDQEQAQQERGHRRGGTGEDHQHAVGETATGDDPQG